MCLIKVFNSPTGFSQVLKGLWIGLYAWHFQFPNGFSHNQILSQEGKTSMTFNSLSDSQVIPFATWLGNYLFFQFPIGFSPCGVVLTLDEASERLSIPYRILTYINLIFAHVRGKILSIP